MPFAPLRFATGLVLTASTLSAVSLLVAAQDSPRAAVRRAARPRFPSAEVDRNWFRDPLAEALTGQRPASLGSRSDAPQNANTTPDKPGTTEATEPPATTSTFAWSTLIPADVIESEIKALKTATDASVTTPNKFAGGVAEVRRDFSVLAMLFGIIADYDTTVRWKNDGAALRDVFARSAANTKTGSPQSYNEAKQRKQDLQDIIGGNPYAASGTVEPQNNWSQICDRAPLMSRLESGLKRIKEGTSDEAAFKSAAETLRNEGALVAAIGEVLLQDGMDDSTEDTYREQAMAMRDAGVELQEAVKAETYDRAVSAMSIIGRSCDDCHNDWR